MKTVKVLVGVAILALLMVMFLFSPKARADGMHGVRETATEVLIQVPKFCRPLKVVWEIRWEENATNKSAMLSFLHADDTKKVRSLNSGFGVAKFQTTWSGAEIVSIPKVDTSGQPIKIKFVSILALGEENGNFSKDNWLYESQNSRWVNGAMISPPVRIGTWGKCK